jgi:hypothetical protein
MRSTVAIVVVSRVTEFGACVGAAPPNARREKIRTTEISAKQVFRKATLAS